MPVRNEDVKIWKYPFVIEDTFVLSLPGGAEVLCAQTQHSQPMLWVKVNTRKPLEERRFFVVGTGHPMPIAAGRYIGTIQMAAETLVWHIFEEAKS